MNMEEAVGIIGLGYVDLPLEAAFGRVADTVGCDLSVNKVKAYRHDVDPMGKVSSDEWRAATRLTVTNVPRELSRTSIVIVAVPTLIDAARQPEAAKMLENSHADAARHEYGIALKVWDALPPADVPVLAVSQQAFRDYPLGTLRAQLAPGGRVVDVKCIVDRAQLQKRNIPLWRL